MIMMLVLVLGTSWAMVGAITQASRNTLRAQRQTGEALKLAKDALLGYLAQQALSSNVPGSFPCPEAANSIGTTNEGMKTNACSTLPVVGRLPWKTLGIDKPLDGAGEALWYVVGTGVRVAPINYSTTGSLTVDGTANAAVALIIAPGAALNSLSSTSTAPSPCTKRAQSAGRIASTLNAADFLECGNATLSSFTTSRSDGWGNDRAVMITSSELLSAIEGAVADRIQRFVAPILNGTANSTDGWYQNVSFSNWGIKFFPYASAWGDPTANAWCGNFGVFEGLLPIASGEVTTGTTCSARWTSASVSQVSGSGTFTAGSCAATDQLISCSFSYSGTPVLKMTATAPNVAMGFRTLPLSGDVTATPASGYTVNAPTGSIIAGGGGQIDVQITMANKPTSGPGTVSIRHPADSILLNTSTVSNPDLAWFINNKWQRYTYYAISPAVTANPSGTCTSADVTNCLTLTNAEAGTGNVNNKRLVLILSGRPLSGKSQPSSNLSDYFELQNDQTSTAGDREFQRNTISTIFNDRPAVCPFQRQTTGLANVLCN